MSELQSADHGRRVLLSQLRRATDPSATDQGGARQRSDGRGLAATCGAHQALVEASLGIAAIFVGTLVVLSGIGSALRDPSAAGAFQSPAPSTAVAVSTPTPSPVQAKPSTKVAETAEPELTPEPPATPEATPPPPAPAKATTYAKLTARQWQQIVKTPDNYIGKGYEVWGCISQFDAATGADAFRAQASNAKQEFWYSDADNAFFRGDEARLADFVQDDMVFMHVVSLGSYSYDTQAGGNTTAPLFQVDAISHKGSCK